MTEMLQRADRRIEKDSRCCSTSESSSSLAGDARGVNNSGYCNPRPSRMTPTSRLNDHNSGGVQDDGGKSWEWTNKHVGPTAEQKIAFSKNLKIGLDVGMPEKAAIKAPAKNALAPARMGHILLFVSSVVNGR
mmetsp:Transcript_23688/g.58069  ORF Transcript_23688/g.58069 Transcript_23688/m.58069 type:complete len:133 (-) Transcript_23688:910-1308(-)